MNEQPQQPTRTNGMSGEAMIGLGITIGAFGVLFLLLGWAEYMRQVHEASVILLLIGAVMFVVGATLSLTGWKRKR